MLRTRRHNRPNLSPLALIGRNNALTRAEVFDLKPFLKNKKPMRHAVACLLAALALGSAACNSSEKPYVEGRHAVKWSFETGDEILSSPALGTDGNVYVGSWDHHVYAINAKDGQELWSFQTGDQVRSSPAIGKDGTVYVGSEDHHVYALDGQSGKKTMGIRDRR